MAKKSKHHGDYQSGPGADNPFAAALANALGVDAPEPTPGHRDDHQEAATLQGQILLYRKKRQGRWVCEVDLSESEGGDLQALASELKKKLSVGGSLQGDTIIVQGDVRDKVRAFFEAKGMSTKNIGG